MTKEYEVKAQDGAMYYFNADYCMGNDSYASFYIKNPDEIGEMVRVFRDPICINAEYDSVAAKKQDEEDMEKWRESMSKSFRHRLK